MSVLVHIMPHHEHPFAAIIEDLWERRTELSPTATAEQLRAIEHVIDDLDQGKLRVAEKINGEWVTHQWIKKAVLLYFRTHDNKVLSGGDTRYYDKVPTKFDDYTEPTSSTAASAWCPTPWRARAASSARASC
jgi:2,3,4,5-tetrahydropyridine-2-carboxylate N-succinyltransferase